MSFYDDNMVWYCPHCKECGFRVAMGAKILMPGQKREPDHESWLKCPDCSLVTPTYIVENDATIIVDDIPTVETPFENTTEIMGLAKRTSKQGIKARKKRNRHIIKIKK